MTSKPSPLSAAPAVVALMVVLSALVAAQEGGAPEPPPAEAERDEALRKVVEAPLLVSRPGMDEVEVRRDVAYTADGEAGPRLDVYMPKRTAEDSSRWPVIVFVHGGPLAPGAYPEAILRPKDWRLYGDYGRLAAVEGYVGVVPNHRYPSTAELERSLGDVAAALDWLEAHAGELGADPGRVGLWLFSGAGAHLGWIAAEAPEGVRAAVAFYPVAGFDAFAALGLGETPAAVVERWGPAARITATSPPLLVARAGRDDPAINASIDAFVAAAIEVGATLELLLHPTGQHGFDARDDVPRTHEIVGRALAFFEDALRRGGNDE